MSGAMRTQEAPRPPSQRSGHLDRIRRAESRDEALHLLGEVESFRSGVSRKTLSRCRRAAMARISQLSAQT